MPSIDRPLSGDVLVFDLTAEGGRAADPAVLERNGRNARTLIKDGPLRVTLVALAAAGELAEHHADGPITIHVIDGAVRFTADGHEHELRSGSLLSAGPGVRHRVTSESGGTFLLTVAQPA